ncbi:MAG: nucleoside hydrolase, partial [Clostridia bacterium]|nr:nucleoside hydrolase [Clostridia bacterium]
MENDRFLTAYERPRGKIDVVLDTDAYNEIDDQFALAYLLTFGERCRIRGITAAPFLNERASSPADGMEK